jgi:hypothetical protein
VTQQPINKVACPEGVTSFNIAVDGSAPFYNYTWQVSTDNGATWSNVSGPDYSGQNTSTLNVNNLTSGNTKSGYLYRTSVSVNPSCPVSTNPALLTVRNIWFGTSNTDWNTASNWSDNAVPSQMSCDSVIILNVSNKPILSSGANGSVNHLVMRPGARLTITGNTMHIAGSIIDDNMAIDATAGTIDLNGNKELYNSNQRAMQIIAGHMFNTPYNNNSGRLMNLQMSSPNNASVAPLSALNDTLNITGVLSFGNVNSKTLNTGDNITMVSDQNGTAQVADITNNGANSGNNFNGQLEVERYINVGQGAGQHAKAWEFLSTPTKGQSVYQSWMENGTFASTGYGTQITSPFGTGFDQSSIYPSMKYYKPGASPNDPQSPDWQGISNTGNQIYDSSGYMLFVRGDRSIQSPFIPANNTRLRTKGNLLTYQVNTPLDATNIFTSIGNPYASAIDMRTVMSESALGTSGFFYVWQSPTYGTYGYGAYVTYLYDGKDFIGTPGGAPNDFIQSGQAFLVQNLNASGNMVFNEPSKASGSSYAIFTPAGISSGPAQLRTNLYRVNNDGSASIADGTLSQYNDTYSNQLDGMDARKFYNSTENLAIRSGGKDLVIERRQTISQADTIFFRFTNENIQHYRFELIAQNLSSNGAQGYFVDKYLNTITPLNMDGATQYNFSIENVSGSKDPGRFYIVFKPGIALPVTITSLKATPVNNQVKVDWNVSNEKDMKQYEVERSTDGVQFTKVATSPAVNTGTANYSWLDANVLQGYYYYRIRCINKDGKIQYTGIVKVLIGNNKPSITIYPNPITNGIINLHLDNLPGGKYGIRLMNQLGQVIVTKQIERTGGSSIESIQWNYNLAHGIYRLEITQPDGGVKEIKVMY